MTKSQDKGEEKREQSSSPKDPAKPFQDASTKFLQATISAQQAAIRDSVQASLDFQQKVRKVEQEAYDAVLEATRKYLTRMSEMSTGNVEETYSSRLQSQMNYETEVRQIYADAQLKLQEMVKKSAPESGDAMKQFSSLRLDAYQQYLSDLQRAWSETTNLDPQAMKTIASSIFCTLNLY
jgi:hypothetical protein